MRPLLITLLTLCLLGASTGSIVAQSASTSPEPVGQLVEVPELGYAVAVPAGAFGIDLGADVEQQVLASLAEFPAATDWLTGGDPAQVTGLIEGLQAKRDSQWQVIVIGDEAMCQYSVIPETPADFDSFALGQHTDLVNNEEFAEVEPPVFLELNGGLAMFTAATQQYGPLFSGGYVGVRETETYWVTCRGPVEPEDRWRSFAEAFEWREHP